MGDRISLNREHWKLVSVMLMAVVDVIKPAILGFVLPGMALEYSIGSQATGTLALVALTGTALLLISASDVIAMLIPYASEIYPVSLRGTGSVRRLKHT